MKKVPLRFPHEKTIRVIADTDAYNEADDQYAIAQMIMTPKFDIRGFVSAHFGKEGSEEASYREILNIQKLVGPKESIPVYHGAKERLNDTDNPERTEGIDFIINEALSDDPRPLFICCMGAHTDVATALLLEPDIAGRFCLISIGGQAYPQGGWEYNYLGDRKAMEVIFRSGVEMWQVPLNVYSTMRISFFELLTDVYPCGALGKYLVERTFQFASDHHSRQTNEDGSWRTDLPRVKGMGIHDIATRFSGDMWCLGDSPCVGLMMNHNVGSYHMQKAPSSITEDGEYVFSDDVTHTIRVYDSIDSRFILSDMKAKLRYHMC